MWEKYQTFRTAGVTWLYSDHFRMAAPRTLVPIGLRTRTVLYCPVAVPDMSASWQWYSEHLLHQQK